MKRLLMIGLVLAVVGLLAYSCNKNRFDFSQLESVEGTGQWKLPIGSAHVTLEQVLSQLNDNDLVVNDEDGNLKLQYRFAMDPIIKGTDVMKYNDVSYSAHFEVDNPYQYVLDEPIDTVVFFDQSVALQSEAATLHEAIIRSGTIFFRMVSNIGNFQQIVLRSPDIFDASGQPLEKVVEMGEESLLDLAGIHIQTEVGDTLRFSYEIHYQMYDLLDPKYMFDAAIGVRDFAIGMLSGRVKAYAAPFILEEPFSLPIDKISGSLKLIDTRLKIQARNSFDLMARLQIDTAELCGDQVPSSYLLDHYPAVYDITFMPTMTDFFDETLQLNVNSNLNKIYASGQFIFNPDGMANLVTVCDTSSIGVAAEAVVPLKFNIPGVHYLDTIVMDLSEVEYPDGIKEVILYLTFDSELPFNLEAQLLTFETATGQVTDSLLANELFISGSFDGQPARTEATISVTHDRLVSLFKADRLIMRYGINTDNRDVWLNLEDGLGVTIKADVFYDGELYHINHQ